MLTQDTYLINKFVMETHKKFMFILHGVSSDCFSPYMLVYDKNEIKPYMQNKSYYPEISSFVVFCRQFMARMWDLSASSISYNYIGNNQ